MLIMILLVYINATLGCNWPKVDTLFVIDSTLNVGVFNFGLIKKFLLSIIDDMEISPSETRIGMAEFTPKAHFEFSLISGINKEEVERRIMMASYSPCVEGESNCLPLASLNSIAKLGLGTASGNRALIPDVLIIISSSAYTMPELGVGETLMKPLSPVFVFWVSVGTLDDVTSTNDKYASSATTIKFSALDYDALQKLTNPLCIAANDFVRRDDNVAKSSYFGGTGAVIAIVILILLLVILLLLLCYSAYHYRNENSSLKAHIALLEERQGEAEIDLYNAKKGMRAEKSKENSVPDVREVNRPGRTDEGIDQKQYDRRISEVVPISWTPMINGPRLERLSTDILPKNSLIESVDVRNTTRSPTETTTESKHTETTTFTSSSSNAASSKNAQQESVRDRRSNKKQCNGNTSVDGDSNRSEDPNVVPVESEEGVTTENNGGGISAMDLSESFLPDNHPAKSLPPIDLLLLVDSSSSIGISNFEQMKTCINAVLDNVDISPGRSRVAAVIFAFEPTVSFDFDKYYTQESVKANVRTLSYLGGPTFLSRALVFAAGMLYQEQNMKDGKHRKHKLMPTPKHDRLQVMIVVSDGYSEDNYDNAAAMLHEKLCIKIAAIVGRSYNKERLLPITRFHGAIFLKEQTEALSIWLWRQQRLWNENFGSYVQKEKALRLNPADVSTATRKNK